MKDKKIVVQFMLLTFGIAYSISGLLIFLSQYGYKVYNWVDTFEQFMMNAPFSLYILSPAIASYIVLKKNNKIASLKEWIETVFHFQNSLFSYLFVIFGLAIYFISHIIVTKDFKFVLPFYTFFLSLPGNLIIGGLEESGWMYVLQPTLDKKYGYVLACLYTGFIWALWHIPLFFIPGTNHSDGLINFWMFNIQIMSFRFFMGAIYKISGKGCVFMCVLFHTMFNAVSPIFGTMTMTWQGTICANAVIIVISLITVNLYNRRKQKILS